MDWSVVYLVFLMAIVVECGREAYGINLGSRHYTRMVKFTREHKPERDFWTERWSWREKRIHQKKHHIDLAARPNSVKRK